MPNGIRVQQILTNRARLLLRRLTVSCNTEKAIPGDGFFYGQESLEVLQRISWVNLVYVQELYNVR